MSPIRMSKLESAMRAVLAFKEAFNRHDVPGIMELMSDDPILESANPVPDGAVYTGEAEVSAYWQDFFSASPDARIEIEDIYGIGERCIMRWNYTWLDASGEQKHIRGVDIFRVRDDFICEQLSYTKG